MGLAQIDKKDWPAAIDSFKTLIDKYPQRKDAKDSLFQLGACYAEQENWPASAEVFARILDRGDLTPTTASRPSRVAASLNST
jgi:TolA-binding protein